MDGKIGLVLEQSHFQFLGKKAFGQVLAFFSERRGLELVSGGFDDFQLERKFGKSRAALRKNHIGLRERQRAAARSDDNGVFGAQDQRSVRRAMFVTVLC